MKRVSFVSLLIFFYLLNQIFPLSAAVSSNEITTEKVIYTDKTYTLEGYLSKPKGKGPFPAVIYNHGGMGNIVGGCPKETSIALAKAGYVGFSPLRRQTYPMRGHLDDVLDALDYIKTLYFVDRENIAIMGFSRGGYLTFMAGAIQRDFKAIVIMACAPGRENKEQFLSHAKKISSPVLLMVAENDKAQADHVSLMKEIKRSLEDENKEVKFILYPPYGNDGHKMFFKIGSYWEDILKFLQRNFNK